MKITKDYLKQVIKEEVEMAAKEGMQGGTATLPTKAGHMTLGEAVTEAPEILLKGLVAIAQKNPQFAEQIMTMVRNQGAPQAPAMEETEELEEGPRWDALKGAAGKMKSDIGGVAKKVGSAVGGAAKKAAGAVNQYGKDVAFAGADSKAKGVNQKVNTDAQAQLAKAFAAFNAAKAQLVAAQSRVRAIQSPEDNIDIQDTGMAEAKKKVAGK